MNKTAIKNYAIWARVNLIEAAKQKAFEYEITENGEMKTGIDSVGGRLLSKAEKEQRNTLIAQIRQKGFNQVMEEVAYTWFNRFIALRFMEVNGYLPSKIRVFTDENGAFKPELLKEAMSVELDGLDRNKVLNLLDKQDNEALYKYLLITQCNALNADLPYMFEKIANWSELLFPANLLRGDSIIGQMISMIPEEDWTDAVQIIGWLYQYYNTELKDDTFAQLKKNVKITKERIPAATQLFTPDWIVRYMVENSLGRLWLEGHPNAELHDGWKYYLDEAEQEPEVEAQLAKLREEYKTIKPEEIKVIDPCMGSGHILVYAFDVLMQIYTSAGWDQREAAQSILKNNLYGLDIDDRAAQLAYFAVMMKARQYDRRLLIRGIQPHIYAFAESNTITTAPLHDMGITLSQDEYDTAVKQVLRLLDELRDAKEYGSILTVTPCDWDLLRRFAVPRTEDEGGQQLLGIHGEQIAAPLLQRLINIGEALSQQYDVVVTNPPYMGASGMNARLSQYIKDHFPDTKADLFACFIERGNQMAVKHGYNCMVTMQSWMFLSSFEKMREKVLRTRTITNLMHMENMVMGIAFGTAVTVFRNDHVTGYKGTYNQIKLQDIENDEPRNFPVLENRFAQTSTDNFSKIPGSPVAYWVSKAVYKMYDTEPIEKCFIPKFGMSTGDGEKFIRFWYEEEESNIAYSCNNEQEFISSQREWCVADKGGTYRRWYGNKNCVIWWKNNGDEIKNHKKSAVRNSQFFFRPHISWTLVSSGIFSARYFENGFLLDTASNCLYYDTSKEKAMYALGYLNSIVASFNLDLLNPTINMSCGVLGNLPYIETNVEAVSDLVTDNVEESRKDWDSYETSWDFKRNPLAVSSIPAVFGAEHCGKYVTRLEDHYYAWKNECKERFENLQINEEELNRIFIDIYGLQDELTPDVADKDVTVHRVFDSKDDVPESMKGSNYVRTMRDEIVSLISYAVGCMFGRYSLDVDGLAYAGGEWDASKYKTIIPDSDNIIPICDDEYFDDDITGRFVEFVRKVYGDDTLEENLKFVADALGGKGTPREVIRSYFLNDFYADHLKTYQKRPIYWLFDSGKKNGFKALIYMHRYQSDLLARMRTDYVHEQQERYRTQLSMLEDSAQSAAASDRVKLNKQIEKLRAQEVEIRSYEEKIHHLADQMIAIDLDDGVKVNYEKFKDVLAKIK